MPPSSVAINAAAAVHLRFVANCHHTGGLLLLSSDAALPVICGHVRLALQRVLASESPCYAATFSGSSLPYAFLTAASCTWQRSSRVSHRNISLKLVFHHLRIQPKPSAGVRHCYAAGRRLDLGNGVTSAMRSSPTAAVPADARPSITCSETSAVIIGKCPLHSALPVRPHLETAPICRGRNAPF